MERFYRLIDQLFAEGAGAGAAAGDGAGAQSQAQGAAVENPVAGEKDIKRQKQVGSLENVKYGIQDAPAEDAPVAGEQEETKPAEDAAQETFEDLIKGKYKQDYERRVQAAIQNRFKNAKSAEDTLAKLAPILQMVGEKYGVDASDVGKMDVSKLARAMESDDSLYEQEAVERGVSIDVLKQMKALERQNETYRRMEEQRAQETETQRHFQNLVQQAETLKQTFPAFDLMAEMQNPRFVELTRQGVNVPVKDAYMLIHQDEIMSSAIAGAAQRGAQKTAASVAAQARRPQEPGSGQPPADIRTDPSKLKLEDFDAILQQVKAGKKIKF